MTSRHRRPALQQPAAAAPSLHISTSTDCISTQLSVQLPTDIPLIQPTPVRIRNQIQLTDRNFTIEQLRGNRQTLSFLRPLLGTLLTFCTSYYLHTDQLDIRYENGVTRSFYPPSQYNILQINIYKPVTFSVCLIRPKAECHKANLGTCLHICTH